MARIAGVDLPKEKRVEIGLTYIYGIGVASSNKILAKAGVNPDTRVKDLTDEEVNSIRKVIDESYKVEGDLRRDPSLTAWLALAILPLMRMRPASATSFATVRRLMSRETFRYLSSLML